jgi:hypothetical protein
MRGKSAEVSSEKISVFSFNYIRPACEIHIRNTYLIYSFHRISLSDSIFFEN